MFFFYRSQDVIGRNYEIYNQRMYFLTPLIFTERKKTTRELWSPILVSFHPEETLNLAGTKDIFPFCNIHSGSLNTHIALGLIMVSPMKSENWK